MALRVVFLGTPAFAVPALEAIARSRHDLVGVVTQPDRPRGRGQKVSAAAVKRTAEGLGVPILQPDRLKSPEFTDAFAALAPDIGVVAAYGKLLPQSLLESPRLGMINVHASLLPRWRGAAPIHRAILAGDRETGITIMRVVLALDAGPMISRTRLEIGPDERSTELESRLAASGATLAVDALDAIESGTVIEEPQVESQVTYAARLVREDGQIDWTRPALEIHNQIRGLHPWPLTSAAIGGMRLRLITSRVSHEPKAPDDTARAGTVTAAGREGLAIATGHGSLLVTELQPEGRPVMSVRDYLNGHPIAAGMPVEPAVFSA